MKEVTISPKTAFRIIQWLSQDNDSDARALVNLLSREALGDIKAEEQHYPLRKDVDNLKKIWNALGMSLSGNPTIERIITTIEHDKNTANDRNKNLSERFELLEILRSQLSVQQWGQMPGALANLKQRLVDDTQARDTLYRIASALQLEEDLTFDGIFDEVLRIYREGNAAMSSASIAVNRIYEMERDI